MDCDGLTYDLDALATKETLRTLQKVIPSLASVPPYILALIC